MGRKLNQILRDNYLKERFLHDRDQSECDSFWGRLIVEILEEDTRGYRYLLNLDRCNQIRDMPVEGHFVGLSFLCDARRRGHTLKLDDSVLIVYTKTILELPEFSTVPDVICLQLLNELIYSGASGLVDLILPVFRYKVTRRTEESALYDSLFSSLQMGYCGFKDFRAILMTLARVFPSSLEKQVYDCEIGSVTVDLYIKYLPVLSFFLKAEDLQFMTKIFPSVEMFLKGDYFQSVVQRFSIATHLQVLDLMLAETRFSNLFCKYNSDYIYESKQALFRTILNELCVSPGVLIEICVGGGYWSLLDAWTAFEAPEMRHCEHMIAYATENAFFNVVRILLARCQFTLEAFESLLSLSQVSERLKTFAKKIFEVVNRIAFKKQSIYANSFVSIVHWRNSSREILIFRNEHLVIVPIFLCRQFGIAPFSVQTVPRERQVLLWDDLINQAQVCLYASHHNQAKTQADIVTIV